MDHLSTRPSLALWAAELAAVLCTVITALLMYDETAEVRRSLEPDTLKDTAGEPRGR